MNPGPDSTTIPTNWLWLNQWNANWIIGKIKEISSKPIMSTLPLSMKQSWPTRLRKLITPGLAAVRLVRLKNNGGGLLMTIKHTIPFVDNTNTHTQSADPYQEQKGISIAIPNGQQQYKHNINILPHNSCSSSIDSAPPQQQRNVAYCRVYWCALTKTEEANNQPKKSIQSTTSFLTRMKQRGYRQMAGELGPTSACTPIT